MGNGVYSNKSLQKERLHYQRTIIYPKYFPSLSSICTGLIYDLTNDYEMSFFFAGTSIALAVVLQMLLSIVKRRSVAMKHQSEEKALAMSKIKTSNDITKSPASSVIAGSMEETKGFKDKVDIGRPVPKIFVIDDTAAAVDAGEDDDAASGVLTCSTGVQATSFIK